MENSLFRTCDCSAYERCRGGLPGMCKRFVEIMCSMRSEKCVIALLVLMGILVGGSSVVLAQTNDKCKIPEEYKKEWTEPEQWAWGEICEGRWADFNKRPGYEKLDPRNPAHDDQWADGRRTLSPRFLKDILLDEPFRSAIPHSGVRINGAYFKDRINLFDKSIQRPLSINSSLFKSRMRMNMDRFQTPESITFAGSRFDGTLDLKSAIIGGDLIIEGAHFNKVVQLDEITIVGDLVMGGEAKFKKKVELMEATVDGRISMQTSTFNDKLDMRSVSIGRDLVMADATFDRVDLSRAKITGKLNMEDSDFKGRLKMESACVAGNLLMGGKAKFERRVVLSGAEIGGDLDMSVSKYVDAQGAPTDELVISGFKSKGMVEMTSALIGGGLSMLNARFNRNVYLNGATIAGDVVLRGTKVAGRLDMSQSVLHGKLDMSFASITSDLLIGDTELKKPANLASLTVDSDLDVRGSILRGLNLTYAQIKGVLLLVPSANKKIKWESHKDKNGILQNPKLILRNASVGRLQDTGDAWPKNLELELDGFTYKRFETGGKGVLGEKTSKWFVGWLEKDKSYSPQPYLHLVDVLRAAGYDEEANVIFSAKRDRELQESNIALSVFIGLARWVAENIGYPYSLRFLVGVIWSTCLVFLGTLILYITGEQKRHRWILPSLLDSACYSLDLLLPVVRLRELHYTVVNLNKYARYYFYAHQILGYALIYITFGYLPGL